MTKVNTAEMRAIEGGASKYVYCPICNYKHKSSLLERLFSGNATVQGQLYAMHMKGGYYNGSQKVHK